MISQPYQLYVERIDAARNMARFYALSIEPTFFGEACLVRRWGRIGSRGRMVIEHYGQEKQAVVAFLDLLRAKRRRGYRTSALLLHQQSVYVASRDRTTTRQLDTSIDRRDG